MGKVEERRARVTDAIIAAAREVMAEGGAAALSLGEVARRVGMRTPSLYGYFSSRAALCDEIFSRGWEDYRRAVAAGPITSVDDATDQVHRALLRAVTWANENRAAAELMFWRPIPNWQPSPGAFASAIAVVADSNRTLRDAQEAGHLRGDADLDEANQVLAALFAGVVSQQLSNEPGVAADTGRTSRYAAGIAAMFVQRYAACAASPSHTGSSR